MYIDENATIGSILKAISDGNKAEHVAKEIDGISQKPLLKALKDAGYAYSNKAPKGWHYVGEGEEPTEKSIFDYVKSSSSRVNIVSHEVITSNTKVNEGNTKVNEGNTKVNEGNTKVNEVSPFAHQPFTRDEITDLVEMLQEWRLKKWTLQEPKQVHERIKSLPQGEKTRKTIVINKAIGDRLDEYCEAERVNKSDVVHLALLDFLNKFGK